MAISTIGTDALASAAVTSAKLASGAPSRSQLPAGTVLQVVNATYGTTVSTSSNSYSDTGLSASITPTSASSKILVIINQQVSKEIGGVDTAMMLKVLRNGADLQTVGQYVGWTNTNSYNGRATFGWQYLDSPATTSAVTYKTQQAVQTGQTGTVRCQYDGSVSTITLMEIAA